MCLNNADVRIIISEELSSHDKIRDKQFDEKIAPLKKNIEEINNLRRRIVWFTVGQLAVFISLIFSAGMWYSSVNRQLIYITDNINRWNLDRKNEPSPYVLNERIQQCQEDQNKTDKQLELINAKLDRLLEKK